MPFTIIREDITRIRADAIVNTANPEPVAGRGTDQGIYHAAGYKKLLRARRRIGRIAVGEAVATKAFGLPAKHIIHTVGPVWRGGTGQEYQELASCYQKSLLLAKQLGCRSIAFPLIAAGNYHFPKEKALEIALREIRAFLKEEEADQEMHVTLAVFNREAFALSEELTGPVKAYIDEKYIAEKRRQEYGGFYPAGAELYPADAEQYPADAEQAALSRPEMSGQELCLHEMPEPEMSVSELYHPEMPGPEMLYSELPGPGMPGPDITGQEILQSGMPGPNIAGQEMFSPDTQKQPARPKASAMGSQKQLARPKASAPAAAGSWKAGRRKTLSDLTSQVGESYQQCLLRHIDENGYTDAEVYKKANIDRRLFSKIRSNAAYRPKKQTALALALALELNLDETVDLIGRAGIALSDASLFDIIIEYCIENKIYDLFTVNALLFEYDQPLLG